ncbi:unnamed protein product, partial [marine sediment metagenome]
SVNRENDSCTLLNFLNNILTKNNDIREIIGRGIRA